MVIEKNYSDQPAMDYAFLRKKAIELVQQYAGKSWTDYNYHDPGVTILECLCYALTDMAYRTGFPIEDILCSPNGAIDRVRNSFYAPQEILTTAPVTARDYRRLLLDRVDELQNVWIEPIESDYTRSNARGLYRVVMQFNSDVTDSPKREELEKELVEKVRRFLIGCRNVAEDFRDFIVLKPQKLQMSASVIIQRKSIAEEVLAKICYTAETYLNAVIKTYIPDELLAMDMPVEDIYAGPLLRKGVILEADLSGRKTLIDPSEIIRSISDIDGVVHISKFGIFKDDDVYCNSPFSLKPFHFPFLEFATGLPRIQLFHNNLPLVINQDIFRDHLHKLRDANRSAYISQLYRSSQQFVAKGSYKKLEDYVSIQNMFPSIYGIGREGIEDNKPLQRKASVKQLKAYLLFFEQVMANYLSQLSKVSELFSPLFTEEEELYTYFVQPLYKIPHVQPLLHAFTEKKNINWEQFTLDESNKYMEALKEYSEQPHQFKKRKKRAVEHVLSRFNIVVDAYPAILFERLYGRWGKDEKIDHELVFKTKLLANVKEITCFRNTGLDYLDEHEMDIQLNGYENKLRLFLYMHSAPPKRVADKTLQYLNPAPVEVEGSDNAEPLNDPSYSAFSFKKQKATFFVNGLERSNYIIELSETGNDYKIIYKDPESGEIEMVAKDVNKSNARKRIGDFIELLGKVSVESEAFYIVDHALLAPHLELDIFGFELFDESGSCILKNKKWRSYNERENDIKTLFEKVEDGSAQGVKEIISLLKEYCDIEMTGHGQAKDETEAEEIFIEKLIIAIDMIKRNLPSKFPCFRYLIRRLDLSSIHEDFFASKLTIVFSAWPARFQEKTFRNFAQRLFRAVTPAHIRIDFLWLPVSKMKKFEDIYYSWLPLIKELDRHVDRINLNEDLISFLVEQTPVKM